MPRPVNDYDPMTDRLVVERVPSTAPENLQVAWLLLLSVARYMRLITLQAPDSILERERRIILRRATWLLTGEDPGSLQDKLPE